MSIGSKHVRGTRLQHFFDASKGRTKQQFKKECDINTIVGRYKKTGALPPSISQLQPRFGYAPSFDLREALQLVHDAGEAFAALPATVRREFDNDPVKFVEFATTEAAVPKLIEWGLLAKKPEEPPVLGSEKNPIHVAGGSGNPA